MIDMTQGIYVLTWLCGLVALSDWLVQKTRLRFMGTALLVILLTAIVANLSLLPAGTSEERPVPVYSGIFEYVAPIAIFWLLLGASLRDIFRAGLPLIGLFIISAIGTTLGIVLGMWLVDAPNRIGPLYAPLGGMFVGTYTGGSLNFNAIALAYGMQEEGIVFGGSIAADNILTALWMVVTLSMPVFLRPFFRRNRHFREADPSATTQANAGKWLTDSEQLDPLDIGLTLALGLAAWWISEMGSAWLVTLGINVPPILLITLLALLLAQWPLVERLRGGQVMGMFAVYLFLAVIGAFCDLSALQDLGRLGLTILGFAGVGILVNGLFTVGGARLLGLGADEAAMISQANVGGGASAIALARSQSRADLVLPAVLLGALGNALGTFLGFWAAEYLLPWIG